MRKVLDKLISWTGLIMAMVLLVAGGLLTWASNFVADNVRSQLLEQKITMPAGAAIEDINPLPVHLPRQGPGRAGSDSGIQD